MAEWEFNDIQKSGADAIIHRAKKPGRMYLADEMRVGKTGTALLVRELVKPKTTLVTAGVNAQISWFEKCEKFGIEPPVVVEGTPQQRAEIWSKGYPFLICTKEVWYRDLLSGIAPDRVGMQCHDEVHKFALNHKGKIYKTLKKVDSDVLIPITGSPLRKGVQNAWAVLNWISRPDWSSYWEYVDQFCVTNRGTFGNLEILGPRNKDQWVKSIQPFLLRRLRKDAGLVGKTREIESIRMTPQQAKIYNTLYHDMILDLPNVFTIAPNTMTKIMYLRQLLVCPQLLDPSLDDGAVMDWMIDKLEDATSPHCVIMTPFPESRKYIKARLNKEGYKDVFIIGSGMKLPDLQKAIKDFRATKGIMICSSKFAEAFELTPAAWGMMAGYEWDIETNWQAEDRLIGGTTKQDALWYYPKHQGTVDEQLMLPALDEKVRNTVNPFRDAEALKHALGR